MCVKGRDSGEIFKKGCEELARMWDFAEGKTVRLHGRNYDTRGLEERQLRRVSVQSSEFKVDRQLRRGTQQVLNALRQFAHTVGFINHRIDVIQRSECLVHGFAVHREQNDAHARHHIL